MENTTKKNWWQSSNFWTALVLIFGGFFVGFPEGVARDAVVGLFALVATGKTLQNFFTNANFEWRKWLDDANFWNYLGTVVITIVPTLPADTITHLETVVRAALGGNWQGMIVALFSLFTVLYKVLKPQKENPEPITT